MTRRFATTVLLLGSILPGCAVGPHYRTPTPEVPEAWHQATLQGLAPGDAEVQEWWQVFADDTLTSLIQRAADGNLDLRIAVLRIREARALRGVAVGELLPALSGSASYDRSKASANGPTAGSNGAQSDPPKNPDAPSPSKSVARCRSVTSTPAGVSDTMAA